jgi:hypothetical protein
MKKVIEGKMYNTETATLLAAYRYGQYGDFKYYSEELYVTTKGNYFLYGEGGALSPYAEHFGGGNSCEGENIVPLSRQEAYDWCEENGRTKTIEKYFSDLVEEA